VTSASMRAQVGLLTWSSTTRSEDCWRDHWSTLVTKLSRRRLYTQAVQDQICTTHLLIARSPPSLLRPYFKGLGESLQSKDFPSIHQRRSRSNNGSGQLQ
jgi:hypothetical protein